MGLQNLFHMENEVTAWHYYQYEHVSRFSLYISCVTQHKYSYNKVNFINISLVLKPIYKHH